MTKNKLLNLKWEQRFGLILIILSLALYSLHYFFFKNMDHIFLWSMTSLAFLPISVLIVTLFINKILVKHQKELSMDKISVILGIFFSEVGNDLVKIISKGDPKEKEIRDALIVSEDWEHKEFFEAIRSIEGHEFKIDFNKIDLDKLSETLIKKKDFFIRLLENPNLLEYDSFTNLSKAIFHLADEFDKRKDIKERTKKDNGHLKLDVERVYPLLVYEWIDYMSYLNRNCKYLFSIAMRTNPFDENASIIIR